MRFPALILASLLSAGCAAATALSVPTNPAAILSSMVRVTSEHTAADKMMTCSAFVVDEDRGWVLTAEHCILANGDRGFKIGVDGSPSELIAKSKWLAVVTIPPNSKPAVRLSHRRPPVGEQVVGVGWAWGKMFLTLPRLSAGYNDTDLMLNGAFIPGMSGGPVVDGSGAVIALIQGGNEAVAYTSGIEEIEEFLAVARALSLE